jgi:hypothetical protein
VRAQTRGRVDADNRLGSSESREFGNANGWGRMESNALLDLSKLRSDSDRVRYSPVTRLGQLADTVGRMRLSRRGLFHLAAAGTSVVRTFDLSENSHNVVVLATNTLLRVLVNKQERWVVDCDDFSGDPRIEHNIGKDEATVALVDARLPGTNIPADFSARLHRTVFGWQIHLLLDFGGFESELPLDEWLLNGQPAKSSVFIPETREKLDARTHLVLGGHGTARVFPDGKFQIEGRSVARIEGRGANISADDLQVSLPRANDTSIMMCAARKRCLVSLDGVGKKWKWHLPEAHGVPWRLRSSEGAFDAADIEFAELSDRTRQSAVSLGAIEPSAHVFFEPTEGLRGLDGSPLALKLVSPRYAEVSSGHESQKGFVAEWHDSVTWAQSHNLALELGGAANSSSFEMLFRNDLLESSKAAPNVSRIALPLVDEGVAASPIAICGTPEVRLEYPGSAGFIDRLKCWLHLCKKNQLCIPLHGSRVSVLRHADLLRLDFQFVHLAILSIDDELNLVRTDSLDKPIDENADLTTLPEALLIVHFPSQNIYEQAFYEGVPSKNKCDPDDPSAPADELKKLPIAARVSGPTRLSFRVQEWKTPYSLESLLNFGQFEMNLAPTAVPAGERPSVDLKPVKPTARETAIELPYRLTLSPNRFGGWASRYDKVEAKNGEWTELWHTRLGVRTNNRVDERDAARRTLRAVWSHDYSDDPCLPRQENKPFRSTLTTRDRIELVELTSNFSLDDPTDDEKDPLKRRRYRPDPVAADFLILSSMGGWLKSTGQWRPPLTRRGQALTIELWKHTATMARDQYVRVEYKGFLLPLGYPCTLVKITERKFVKVDGARGKVACLEQRLFILIKREEKSYPALGQQFGGRAWPFVKVQFEKNFTTPVLKWPDDQSEFWPQTQASPSAEPQDILFHYQLEDSDGTTLDVSSPLKFVDATVAYSECTADDLSLVDGKPCESNPGGRCDVVIPAQDRLGCAIDEYNSDLNRARRTIKLNARKFAYARSKKPGDTQFETACFLLGAERSLAQYTCRNLFAHDQAPIYPAIETANVRLASISELTGAGADTTIAYHDLYLKQGFSDGANRGEVFAEIVGKSVAIAFGGAAPNGDRAGGVVTPNAAVVGLSRRIGPVGGSSTDSLQVTASASFDPSFFANALSEAKILGGIRLVDIIRPFASGVADALEKAPKILRRALSTVEATLEAEAREFYSLADKLRGEFEAGIAGVEVLKSRFQPRVDVIAGDLASLQTALNQPHGDDFTALARDQKLVAIQGQIVNEFRNLAADIDDTVRHPQTLVAAEIASLLDKSTAFLTQALSPAVAQLEAWAQSGLDAIITKLIGLIASATDKLTHSQAWQNSLNTLRQNLSGAIASLGTGGTLDQKIAKIANVIDSFNQARSEVRRIADLGSVIATDLNGLETGVKNLAGAVPADFQAQRAALEAAFAGVSKDSVAAQQAETALFASLGNVETLWQQFTSDTGQLFAAQADLVRSVQALRKAIDQNCPCKAQIDAVVVPWVSKFTSIARVTETTVQNLYGFLQQAGRAAAEFQRVRARGNAFVADVAAARQALIQSGGPEANMDGAADLLNRTSKAGAYLAEAIEILPLDSSHKQMLAQAESDLNAAVATIQQKIDVVKEVFTAMRALQANAPYILQAVIQEEIDELYAPYAQYAGALEDQAISIISTLISNLAKFATELVQRLEIPPDKLTDLLRVADSVAGLLSNLLTPQAVELAYTFNPAVKESPGGVFQLIPSSSEGTEHLLISVRVRTYIQRASGTIKPPEYEIQGTLQNFAINLLNKTSLQFITINFDSLKFTSTNGSQPHCDVQIKNVEFGQALTFVKNLQNLLNPSEGPYLILAPSGLTAGFRFSLPKVSAGGFSLKNLRFDASIVLPFTGDPARFKFAISSRDNPFQLSVGIFGGGGWFSLSIGLDGVDETELGLEFGLAGDISIGVATGYGRVMAGIYIRYQKGKGVELAGFIDIAGHVDVLGLISLSLSVYYGLRRLSSGQCFGEATITVKIEMFMFDVEVHLHTEKQFAGDSSGGAGANRNRASQLYASTAITSLSFPEEDSCPSPPSTDEKETEERELDWDAFLEAFAEVETHG